MGNREDLLAGAKRCLVEKGWGATTVRDIATAAGGISHAAIGYHFGSKDALLHAALVDAMDDWGDQIGDTLASDGDAEQAWQRVIDSVSTNRELFIASVELMLQAHRFPELRRHLTSAQEEGRRGLAARLIGVDEADVPDETVRTIGSVHLALFSGLVMQTLADPEHAPTGAEIIAGLRALVAVETPHSGATFP
ncbi:TetR/AcrR family transcriptional regulator [Phytoactinopolyspora limicola]|uniref:TetR/AcrR family transcriptional regulator n=1 Tax=Phytoactinopolyspora limicola TaxID=2715536 RepID=UPI00140CBF1C|nr:TetR/AcrR family transcriptional regulator [Phytoactinopolyspora limicola]